MFCSPRRRTTSLLAAAALAAVALTGSAGGAATASASTGCPAGPDVSRWQHPNGAAINWSKVAAACNSFAIIKATEGDWYTNPYFAGDWSGTRNAGLYHGAYHFARPALPISTAKVQADHFADVIGSQRVTGDLPPILDLEEDGGLSQASLITWAQTFLAETQRRTGRTPAVYTYRYFWGEEMANTRALHRYPLWIADYSSGVTSPNTPLIGQWKSWRLWQYTAAASVAGIAGSVDRSRFNGTMSDLATFADGAHAQTLEVRAPWAPVGTRAGLDGTTAVVSWLPTDNGGALVSRYTVTASPGGSSASVTGVHHIARLTGLRPGVTYRFTVRATNTAGLTSVASAETNAVTPYVPVTLSVSGDRGLTYGDDTVLTARLTRSDTGAALTGQPLSVLVRKAGTTSWTSLDPVTTGGDGTASVPLQPSRNELVRFSFAGTGSYRSATTTAAVVVHPKVTAALSATTVRSGGSVKMTGTVSPVLAGATVYRQGYYDGSWHTWATATVTRTGTYSFTIRPSVKTTDIYRVRIGASTRFGAANSPRVSLKVT